MNLVFSQKHIFYLFPHHLASGDPDGWCDRHCHQPGQPRTDGVEHLKECSEEADEEHHHVKETERHEARVQGDKLYMMVEAMCWVQCLSWSC